MPIRIIFLERTVQMNNVLSSMQTLKSSENCDKYSTRFLYKNLVGGTATTGRDRKQTQRLCEYCADKPLSAVGTLTSLLCNSAKVVEKILQMLLVFKVVKVFSLVAVLSISMVSESSAEDGTPTIVGRGNCGASCTYTLDSAGTLTLYGEGDMTEYDYSMFGDKYKWNDGNDLSPGDKYGEKIKSIIFAEGSNITSIGKGSFIHAGISAGITIPDSVTKIGNHSFQTTGLTELTIPESVTSIKNYAFWGAKNLTSINIPESVKYIGSTAFRDTPKLSEIIIPDTIDTSRWDAMVFNGLSPDTEIVCLGDEEKCKQKLAKYIPTDKGGTCTNYCINKEIKPAQSSAQCNGSYIYENGKCHKRNENQCNDTGDYYYNGATCLYRPRNRQVVCVNPNYKANDGYCDRLRYTPAEAAEVLKDDNTNSVTITFNQWVQGSNPCARTNKIKGSENFQNPLIFPVPHRCRSFWGKKMHRSQNKSVPQNR